MIHYNSLTAALSQPLGSRRQQRACGSNEDPFPSLPPSGPNGLGAAARRWASRSCGSSGGGGSMHSGTGLLRSRPPGPGRCSLTLRELERFQGRGRGRWWRRRLGHQLAPRQGRRPLGRRGAGWRRRSRTRWGGGGRHGRPSAASNAADFASGFVSPKVSQTSCQPSCESTQHLCANQAVKTDFCVGHAVEAFRINLVARSLPDRRDRAGPRSAGAPRRAFYCTAMTRTFEFTGWREEEVCVCVCVRVCVAPGRGI